MYNLFRCAVDPTSGRAFFHNGHHEIFEKEMKYVRKGLWSDPPGLEMRVLRRRLAACAAPHSLIPQVLRLQDAQDRVCGVPVPALDVAARGLLCACALSAGGRLQDNIVKAFIFRWFVSALLGRGVCTRHGCGACNSTSPPPAASRRTGPRGGCHYRLARPSCGRASSTLSRPPATSSTKDSVRLAPLRRPTPRPQAGGRPGGGE